MINLLAVIIGLFILAAIVKNKDFDKPENKEKRGFLTFSVLLLVLIGLGFLMPGYGSTPKTYSMLFFFLGGFAVMTASTSGPIKIYTRVAWVTVLAFIIMGSF